MSHDPFDYPLSRYLLFALIGLLGGLVARLQYWAGGEHPHCWRCALFRLTVDMVTSGFCGVLTFWVATEFELSGVLTAVLAGISGHMGSRALFLIERIIQKRLQPLTGELTQSAGELTDPTGELTDPIGKNPHLNGKTTDGQHSG